MVGTHTDFTYDDVKSLNFTYAPVLEASNAPALEGQAFVREVRFVTAVWCRLLGPVNPVDLQKMQVEHLMRMGVLDVADNELLDLRGLTLRQVLLSTTGLREALNYDRLKADRQRIQEILDRIEVNLKVAEATPSVERGLIEDKEIHLQSTATNPTEELNGRFFKLLFSLTRLSKQVVKGVSERDKVNLFAWVEQSANAVTPDYVKEIGLYQLFVRQLVLLVIIFDDITETATGDDFSSFLPFLGRIVKNRLNRKDIELETIEGFPDLSRLHQQYAYLVKCAFDLYDDTVETLCPTSLDHSAINQIRQIRAAMSESLKELFEMIDFSSRVDAKVRAAQNPVVGALAEGGIKKVDDHEVPGIDEWIDRNKAGTQMKHMLLASFLQQWGLMNDDERKKYDFDIILREIMELGDGIDRIGNLSNDFATLLRELGQKNAANSIVILAINEGIITIADVQAAFQQIENLTPAKSNQLMAAISKAFFADTYVPEETFGFDSESIDKILELVSKLLNSGGAFDRMLDYWKTDLDELKGKFVHSSLANFMNVGKLLDAQLGFLRQYVAVSGNI